MGMLVTDVYKQDMVWNVEVWIYSHALRKHTCCHNEWVVPERLFFMKISRQAVSSTETQDVVGVYIFLPPASYPWKQTDNQPYTHNANAFNQNIWKQTTKHQYSVKIILSEKTLKNQKRPIYVFIEVPKALLVHLLSSTAYSCMINCLWRTTFIRHFG